MRTTESRDWHRANPNDPLQEPAMVYLVDTDAESGAHHHTSFLGLIWMSGRVAPYGRRWFGISTDRRWFVTVQVFGRYVGVCWG